jgi:hypothetical protein
LRVVDEFVCKAIVDLSATSVSPPGPAAKEAMMNRIVVDQTLRTRLQNMDARLELCDEAGMVLGYFVPASERQRLLYEWARGQFNDDDLAKARAQSGGFSLTEILAELAQS